MSTLIIFIYQTLFIIYSVYLFQSSKETFRYMDVRYNMLELVSLTGVNRNIGDVDLFLVRTPYTGYFFF